MRKLVLRTILVVAVAAGTLIPAQAAFAFTDVPSTYWDYTAIQYVASTNTWMQDYGTSTFLPTGYETRKYAARSLVWAYAPTEPIDPTITFPDLASDDPFYPYANVAVKLGWMPKYKSGIWNPDHNFATWGYDEAITQALGLQAQIAGLQNLKETNGTPYEVSEKMPYVQLAHYLDLHYNHDDESLDLQPTTYIKRDEAAYTLWKAKTLQQWQLDATEKFSTIVFMGIKSAEYYKQQLTQEALNQIGEPYIWGGEWDAASPSGYCCGTQPQGGYDCSGLAWWVMKKYEGGYNAAAFRSQVYTGWSLPDRTSSYMALNTKIQRAYDDLKIGDLMFFATDGGSSWSDVDHVGIYVGADWMIHSSGSTDGPVIEWVGDGYYHDIFVYGRRLIGASLTPLLPERTDPNVALAGDPW